MWNQFKRVSIPVFNGDKRLYEGWKTAFMACVDKAPATPEYKLLQLRQYLSGEALKVVEPLRRLMRRQRKDWNESFAANGVRLLCI